MKSNSHLLRDYRSSKEMGNKTFSLTFKRLRFHKRTWVFGEFFTETMHVSSGGFVVKDHKTSFLQFNNPFNTIFQSHFMLSKARISELFADTGFVEELLFIKRWRHDLIMVHHYWVASVPHPSNAFLWCVQFFHSNDSCLMLKWFDSTCLLLEERHIPTFCLKNLFKCSPLLKYLWILRRKYEFYCLKMNKDKGNSGHWTNFGGAAQWVLDDSMLKLNSSMSFDYLWNTGWQITKKRSRGSRAKKTQPLALCLLKICECYVLYISIFPVWDS